MSLPLHTWYKSHHVAILRASIQPPQSCFKPPHPPVHALNSTRVLPPIAHTHTHIVSIHTFAPFLPQPFVSIYLHSPCLSLRVCESRLMHAVCHIPYARTIFFCIPSGFIFRPFLFLSLSLLLPPLRLLLLLPLLPTVRYAGMVGAQCTLHAMCGVLHAGFQIFHSRRHQLPC